MRSIISDKKYAGKTNRAFAEAIKRLVHFAKAGEIGEKRDGRDYVPEVSWIRPEVYVKNGRKREIRPGDLLTGEEIEALLDAIPKISRFPGRDRAMVMCLYEGAFRPGELLNMTVGGVLFKDKVAVVTTVGKTGEKTVPLLLSYRLLLDWIEQHPFKDNLDAPLWWSFATGKGVGYGYLRKVVKKAALEAGIKKKVWNYLLRHTKLTDVAKKHPDQILKRFGNWKKGTEMMDVYIHLSESDLEEAVLKEHGLLPEGGKKNGLALKTCPRCGEQNAGAKRCTKCGYIIDEKLAIKITQREQSTLEGLTRTVKEHEHVQKKDISDAGRADDDRNNDKEGSHQLSFCLISFIFSRSFLSLSRRSLYSSIACFSSRSLLFLTMTYSSSSPSTSSSTMANITHG